MKCRFKKKIIAILKDDAYGLGIKKIASTLADDTDLIIGVNSFDDIEKIKSLNRKILYMNIWNKNDLPYLKKNNISVIVSSLGQIEEIKNTNIPFHIKLNVGMNRIGMNEEEYDLLLNEIEKNPTMFNLEGIMSHFPNADDDHRFYKRFEELVKKCKKKDLIIHCFSSSSIKEFDNITTHIRIGIKLYGVDMPSLFFHNALYLYSPIIQKRKIKKGEKVGYDLAFAPKEDGYLYLIPLGYGQGYGRFIDSYAYFDGIYLKQMSKNSMDYSMFYSTKDIPLFSNIELFGENISLSSLALLSYMDPHEILVKLKVDKEYFTYL